MTYYLLCIKDSKSHFIGCGTYSEFKNGMIYNILYQSNLHVYVIIDNRISIISINDIFYEYFKIVNILETRRLKILQINKR